MAETKKVLEERGYAVRTAPGQSMATEWKEEMANSSIAGAYSRYLVEGIPLSANTCQIRIHRQTSTVGAGNPLDVEADTLDRSATPEGPTGTRGGNQALNTSNVVDQNVTRTTKMSKDAAEEIGGKRAENAMVSRDLSLEWLLMQRLAPGDAKELRLVADEKFK